MTRTKSKAPKKRKKRVVAYLRVSTVDQNTEKNEAAVLRFANAHDLGKVEWVEEHVSGMRTWKKRKLRAVVEGLHAGDTLIVPELSRLGRSIWDILDLLHVLRDKRVSVFSVKEGFELTDNGLQAKIMTTLLALFAEVEHDLISQRTREGLEAAKASGKQLGRPKGPGKSRLDPHREEIIALIKNGTMRMCIAARYGVVAGTLTHWLKVHKLDELKPVL